MPRNPVKRGAGPATGVADGSRRLEHALRAQLSLLRATAARLDATGSDDVHDARVAARRLRSLLKTFRPFVDDGRARRLRAELRAFARSLSQVREADVRRELLLALARSDAPLEPPDIRRLGRILGADRRTAREKLRSHAVGPDWRARLAAIEQQATAPWLRLRPDASLAELLARIDRVWRRAERIAQRGPRSAGDLHELRLALKHGRYALEPVADANASEAAEVLRRLRKAQDQLGDHRDAVLACTWVRANEPALGSPLAGELLQRLERHEKSLRARASRRARDVPSAFRRWRNATRAVRKGRSPGPA